MWWLRPPKTILDFHGVAHTFELKEIHMEFPVSDLFVGEMKDSGNWILVFNSQFYTSRSFITRTRGDA